MKWNKDTVANNLYGVSRTYSTDALWCVQAVIITRFHCSHLSDLPCSAFVGPCCYTTFSFRTFSEKLLYFVHMKSATCFKTVENSQGLGLRNFMCQGFPVICVDLFRSVWYCMTAMMVWKTVMIMSFFNCKTFNSLLFNTSMIGQWR